MTYPSKSLPHVINAVLTTVLHRLHFIQWQLTQSPHSRYTGQPALADTHSQKLDYFVTAILYSLRALAEHN